MLGVCILCIFCKAKFNGEVWEITAKTVTKHTYTNTGLLDTSFITKYTYVKGEELNKEMSMTLREYDTHNNLISYQTYLLLPDNKTEMVQGYFSAYDKFNNLISYSIRSKGVDNGEKYLKEYNEQKQLIKSTAITKNFDTGSSFDTAITTFTYNADGNCTKETTTNTRNELQEIKAITYAGKEKVMSYTTNDKNETGAIFHYVRREKLLLQILNDKQSETIDTAWYDGEKEIKYVSRSQSMRFKFEMKYDSKGNEIESVSYKGMIIK